MIEDSNKESKCIKQTVVKSRHCVWGSDPSCVATGKLLKCVVPQFPHLQNGLIIAPTSRWFEGQLAVMSAIIFILGIENHPLML